MIKKHTLEVRHIRIDSPKSLTSSARKGCAATRSDSDKALADGDVKRANREKEQVLNCLFSKYVIMEHCTDLLMTTP